VRCVAPKTRRGHPPAVARAAQHSVRQAHSEQDLEARAPRAVVIVCAPPHTQPLSVLVPVLLSRSGSHTNCRPLSSSFSRLDCSGGRCVSLLASMPSLSLALAPASFFSASSDTTVYNSRVLVVHACCSCHPRSHSFVVLLLLCCCYCRIDTILSCCFHTPPSRSSTTSSPSPSPSPICFFRPPRICCNLKNNIPPA